MTKVLWALDNEISARGFERLCVDLLFRAGYKDIVPIQPQDGGRDAQQEPRAGRGQAGEAAFFQFSSEGDWKAKLRRDAKKLKNGKFEFSTLVFVTSRDARGVDCDALSKDFKTTYGWTLVVFGREWLRLQLEEAHPDLAQKYLGIEAPGYSPRLSVRMQFGKSSDERLTVAWLAFNAEQFERAAVEFREFLNEHGTTDHEVLEALAWCQYRLYRYDEALASINRALRLQASGQAQSIRACILVEKGIRDHDRASLLEGRRIFERVLAADARPNWHRLYDLGNVESALGNHHQAIELYRRALDIDGGHPEVWKNLATAYHLVGDHDTEMECLDEVLRREPDKVEALVSKGTSLMLDLNRAQDAIPLLERALAVQQDWAVHWPHIWYWLAEAHRQVGNYRQAHGHVNDGLAHQPGNAAMKRLKSDLLVELVRTDPEVVADARHFWESCLTEQPRDFTTRERLVQMERAQGNSAAVWRLLEECFEVLEFGATCPLRESGFDVDQCLIALKYLPQYLLFRERMPVSDYWNADDPLYDLPFAPPGSSNTAAALSTFLAIPFGVAFNGFETLTTDRQSTAALVRLKETLGPLVETAFARAARQFACAVPGRQHGADAVAETVTNMLLFLGLAAMREFSRQFGWIPSQFRVPTKTIDAAIDPSYVTAIQGNVMIASFVNIAEAAPAFSDAQKAEGNSA
jgi:tetratricopeptide (TPR) repeat protein